VAVPPGEHELVFKYLPARIYAAMAVGGAALLAVIIVLVWKRPRKGPPSQS
jgi:hypothetical protein